MSCTNDWLRNVVGYKGVASLGTVTESDEANELLQTVRGRGLAPLYHWQSRLHVRVGQVITHRELPDGYLLDNRIWRSRIPNVVPKCVPSLLDIKKGVFSIRTTADRVGIGLREFARFCRTIRVEGGRKIRRKGALIIEPVRKRKLKVRLSGNEYDALTKVAKDRGYTRNISSFFRDSLISSLMIRMEWRGAM
jgi:hypothetical protein